MSTVTAPPAKKHRQTRIVEHLKTVKKQSHGSSGSALNKKGTSSSSSSSRRTSTTPTSTTTPSRPAGRSTGSGSTVATSTRSGSSDALKELQARTTNRFQQQQQQQQQQQHHLPTLTIPDHSHFLDPGHPTRTHPAGSHAAAAAALGSPIKEGHLRNQHQRNPKSTKAATSSSPAPPYQPASTGNRNHNHQQGAGVFQDVHTPSRSQYLYQHQYRGPASTPFSSSPADCASSSSTSSPPSAGFAYPTPQSFSSSVQHAVGTTGTGVAVDAGMFTAVNNGTTHTQLNELGVPFFSPSAAAIGTYPRRTSSSESSSNNGASSSPVTPDFAATLMGNISKKPRSSTVTSVDSMYSPPSQQSQLLHSHALSSRPSEQSLSSAPMSSFPSNMSLNTSFMNLSHNSTPRTPLSSASLTLSMSTDGRACLAPLPSSVSSESLSRSASQRSSRKLAPLLTKASTTDPRYNAKSTKVVDFDSASAHHTFTPAPPQLHQLHLSTPSHYNPSPLSTPALKTPYTTIDDENDPMDVYTANAVDETNTLNEQASTYSSFSSLDSQQRFSSLSYTPTGSSDALQSQPQPQPQSMGLVRSATQPVLGGMDFTTNPTVTPSRPQLGRTQSVGGNNSVAAVPFYPAKERFQSSWKFPLSGLQTSHLDGSAASVHGSSLSPSGTVSPISLQAQPSSTPFQELPSFPFTAPLFSNPSVEPSSGQSLTMGDVAQVDGHRQPDARKSRIQAWLDSPDTSMPEEATEDSNWSNLPNDCVDPGDLQTVSLEAIMPHNPQLQEPLDLSKVRPSTSMQAGAIDPQVPADGKITPHKYEDYFDEVDGVRVSGKSVRTLKLARKRRFDNDTEGGLDEDGDLTVTLDTSSPTRSSALRKDIASAGSPNSKKSSPNNGAGQLAPAVRLASPAAAKTRKGQRKGRGSGNKTAVVKCPCGTGDDGEAMVQCDMCAAWYHLACLKLDDSDLPDEWHCYVCIGEGFAGRGATDEARQARPAGLAASATINPPSTPHSNRTQPREPTFSQTNTPRTTLKHHFRDTDIVLAPSPRPGMLPTTPRQGTNDSSTRGHTASQSLSRQYAPVTPRLGFGTSSTVFGQSSAHSSNYSPRSPNVTMRRPSGSHLRTPSVQFQWGDKEEFGSAGDRSQQWDLFYTNNANLNAVPMIPMTPPMGHGVNHAQFNVSADSFLPPLDPDEAARQRFLELNSTPSRWGDSGHFPTTSWN